MKNTTIKLMLNSVRQTSLFRHSGLLVASLALMLAFQNCGQNFDAATNLNEKKISDTEFEAGV